MQEYSGSRIVNYCVRKLVIVYFTNNNALKVACATKIPQIANPPFKPYIKTEIDCEITSARNQEKFVQRRSLLNTIMKLCTNSSQLMVKLLD